MTVFFLFCFSSEIWDRLGPKYPEKVETQTSGEKRTKRENPLAIGLAGAHETRVQNVGVYLSKTAWTLDSEGVWGLCLNPPIAE